MLHFEGDREFPQAPADLWTKLTDARFLTQCVPGVESISHSELTKVICTLRPGFAFVRGTLELSMEVVDAVPNTSARILLNTKGIGSSSTVEASFGLSSKESGTALHWSADLKSLGGLLKAVPQGLIKASAQRVIADALGNVETKIAEEGLS
jgi:carbon monoxide dehydrogenase subunit G